MSLRTLKKNIRYTISEIMTNIYDRPLCEKTDREKELIEEMRSYFQKDIGNLSQDSPESEKDWYNNQERLRDLVLNDDLQNFLRWDVIIKTMSVVHGPYVPAELNYLKKHPKWNVVWKDAIEESATGHPTPYWRYPSSSENLITHAHHICRFEDLTGKKVSDYKYVVEFGGGYGSLCRLMYKLGFQGKYIIFDFEVFSQLQRFYLRALGLNVQMGFGNQDCSQVFCISEIEQFKQTLLQINLDESLFVATWSISETPLDFRKYFFPFLADFNSYLIGYQAGFKEVDNLTFFREWQDSLNNINWIDSRIEIMKHHHRYLFGTKKIGDQ